MAKTERSILIPSPFIEMVSKRILPPLGFNVQTYEGKNGSEAGRAAARNAVLNILPIPARANHNPSGFWASGDGCASHHPAVLSEARLDKPMPIFFTSAQCTRVAALGPDMPEPLKHC